MFDIDTPTESQGPMSDLVQIASDATVIFGDPEQQFFVVFDREKKQLRIMAAVLDSGSDMHIIPRSFDIVEVQIRSGD